MSALAVILHRSSWIKCLPQFLSNKNMTVVCPSPPYWLHLGSLDDSWLFLKVQRTRKGKGFEEIQDVKAAATAPRFWVTRHGDLKRRHSRGKNCVRSAALRRLISPVGSGGVSVERAQLMPQPPCLFHPARPSGAAQQAPPPVYNPCPAQGFSRGTETAMGGTVAASKGGCTARAATRLSTSGLASGF